MAVATYTCAPCCGGSAPGPFPCCNPPGVPLLLTGTWHVLFACGPEVDGVSSSAIYNAVGDGTWRFGYRVPDTDGLCVLPATMSQLGVTLFPCDSDDPFRFRVAGFGNFYRCCPASPPAASPCCDVSVGLDTPIFPDSASCDPFVLVFTLTSSGTPIFTFTVTG